MQTWFLTFALACQRGDFLLRFPFHDLRPPISEALINPSENFRLRENSLSAKFYRAQLSGLDKLIQGGFA
jgi:hypothetical protein